MQEVGFDIYSLAWCWLHAGSSCHNQNTSRLDPACLLGCWMVWWVSDKLWEELSSALAINLRGAVISVADELERCCHLRHWWTWEALSSLSVMNLRGAAISVSDELERHCHLRHWWTWEVLPSPSVNILRDAAISFRTAVQLTPGCVFPETFPNSWLHVWVPLQLLPKTCSCLLYRHTRGLCNLIQSYILAVYKDWWSPHWWYW